MAYLMMQHQLNSLGIGRETHEILSAVGLIRCRLSYRIVYTFKEITRVSLCPCFHLCDGLSKRRKKLSAHNFPQIIKLWQFTDVMPPRMPGSPTWINLFPQYRCSRRLGVLDVTQHAKMIFSISHPMRSRSLIRNN
jgi:hypothetical protein